MPQTLDQIKQDFQSYKAVARRQDGVTLYAEKYVEDVGFLLQMLEPATSAKSTVRKTIAKAPQSE